MNERYFSREYNEQYYIFDSKKVSEETIDNAIEYKDYSAFADSMSDTEIVELLNKGDELMTSKMINRYVIKDEDGNIINEIDDIRYSNLALKVYDREEEINIAKMNINDRELNYLMATSVIEAINNYPEMEEVTEEP